ncbi:MAG: hypothetical protein US03_C0010G0054 [candidate division TM6 bacterium GW2011_GWF2_36_131]|nr:MAG: hypothetical protein US03_C0010G0054 [candidate division TM6 bacterium GW2011_GWF2_36_131]
MWYQNLLSTNSTMGCFAVGAATSFLTNVSTDEWGEPLVWSIATSGGSYAGVRYALAQEGLRYDDDSDKIKSLALGITVGTGAGKGVRYAKKGLTWLALALYHQLRGSQEDKKSDKSELSQRKIRKRAFLNV